MEPKHLTIEELLELAHKHRALHIKAGPLEITLHPSAFEGTPGVTEIDSVKMPSDAELQFAAGAQFEASDAS